MARTVYPQNAWVSGNGIFCVAEKPVDGKTNELAISAVRIVLHYGLARALVSVDAMWGPTVIS